MRLGLADPTPTPNPNQVKPAWGLCYDAAKTAGAALAAQLRARGCGARPASLLGVSLGARVVWHCLELLAALPAAEAAGLVQAREYGLRARTAQHAYCLDAWGGRPHAGLGLGLGLAALVMHCARHCVARGATHHATYHHAALPQDVVLLAAPVTVNAARWEKVSAVVAGRLINAFVRDNMQLGQVRVRVRVRVRIRVRVRDRVRLP